MLPGLVCLRGCLCEGRQPPNIIRGLQSNRGWFHISQDTFSGETRCLTCTDVPAWLPELRMVLRDAETNLLADFKSPRRAQEHKFRRLVRVLCGEDDSAVVQSAGKGRFFWPAQQKVPVKQVVIGRVGIEFVRRLRALHVPIRVNNARIVCARAANKCTMALHSTRPLAGKGVEKESGVCLAPAS